MNRAPLVAQIPTERVHTVDGSFPKIGDVVVLDQGFTFPDGRPGCLVFFPGQDGTIRWEAEVYESELGDNLHS